MSHAVANRTKARLHALALAKGEPIAHVAGEFGIVVDSREQRPWPLIEVAPLVVAALPAGDYSVIGHETEVAIERKSLDDLVGSVTRENRRFQRELEKLAAYNYAAVVVEATHADVLGERFYRKEHSGAGRASGEQVMQTVATLTVKHRVPFFFTGSVNASFRWALRLLQTWHDRQKWSAA